VRRGKGDASAKATMPSATSRLDVDVEPYVDAVEGAMLKFYSWACTLTYEERLQMVRQRERASTCTPLGDSVVVVVVVVDPCTPTPTCCLRLRLRLRFESLGLRGHIYEGPEGLLALKCSSHQ
jgi:hypothetical protein